MQYEFAPMEGFTDSVFRVSHTQFFPGGTADHYYTPFITPTKEHLITPKQLREILPENNAGIALVPQLLTNCADDFIWMCGELSRMGYSEVNLNLGCPSGTVVAKGKGSGFLREPTALDRFLDAVYSAVTIKVSLKTRLGLNSPEEFGPLLEIFNRYPVSTLIIHPRVQKDMYRCPVRMDIFEQALSESRNPVCYNGDLYAPQMCRAFADTHSSVCGIMLGRGMLADPALIRKIRGGAPADKETLRAFHDHLLSEYTVQFGRPQSAIRRMKGLWTYLLCLFSEHEKLEKVLRQATDPWDYNTAVDCIFSQLELLPDAVNVK